jgi:hypothetical protein
MCDYTMVEELVTILLSRFFNILFYIRGGIIRAIQRTYNKIMY